MQSTDIISQIYFTETTLYECQILTLCKTDYEQNSILDIIITNHDAEIETNLNLIVAFQCISFPLKNMQLAVAILMIASPFMMPIHKQSSAKLNNFFYPNNLVIT